MPTGHERLIKYIIIGIHFIASFFYERLLFDFSKDRTVVLSIAKNNLISDNFEFVESYIFSKIFALIFIFIFWSVIFYFFNHINKMMIIHFVIFVVGAVLLYMAWPRVFTASEDNYVTLSYALRFYPEYWHSAYSSFVYAGMMMVFPHPFAITFLQWMFFIASVGYISVRAQATPLFKGHGLYIGYLMIIVPEWFLLVSNAYRTEQYAILCVFYLSIIIFDIIDHRERTIPEILGISLLSAFISVWRSEGIILGFLGFATLIFLGYRKAFKKALMHMLVFILFFVAISMPQKLGDKKYYGKDYSFINSFPTMHNILNANDGVLKEYEGLESDLAAIEKVVPKKLVMAYGMEGYRRFNYANGRDDINQSLCDDETASEYMRAYYRMVLNNPVIYAKTQVSMLLRIAGIREFEYVEAPHINGTWNDIENYYYKGWDIGRADLNSMPLVEHAYNSKIHNTIGSIVIETMMLIRKIIKDVYLRTFMIIMLPLCEIAIVVFEFVRLVKRKPHMPGLGALALVLLGQATAIALVMPAAVIAYFHAYLFCSAMLVVIYSIVLKNERINSRLPKN